MSADQYPTHVLLPCGVGTFASAFAAHLRESMASPMIVLYEPATAACAFESIKAGKATTVGGDHHTMMAGMACGEVSSEAWPILRDFTNVACKLSESISGNG